MSASHKLRRSPGVTLLIAGVLILSLSSCTLMSPGKGERTISTTPTVDKGVQEGDENALLANCQQELKALRTVAPTAASPLSDHFDGLMQRMHQYAGFRTTLSVPLQQTMDALYRYRVNKVCADIRHTLLDNLSQQAERE